MTGKSNEKIVFIAAAAILAYFLTRGRRRQIPAQVIAIDDIPRTDFRRAQTG